MTQNRSSAVMQKRIEPQIISRSDALKLGLLRYFTGKPCARGHLSERQASNWACMACAAERCRQDRRANPERAKERDLRKYWKNPEKSRAELRAQREKHIEKRREYDRQRYQDPDYKDRQKKQATSWARQNRAKRAALIAAYRAAKTNATPPWLTRKQRKEMRKFYLDAGAREGDWHVDHIIPIKGKTVSGLHVPWNLQVITASQNQSKGNRYGAE